MEAEQDHLRKKTPHSTACWDCYRNHRGCDGLRPCKRCVALGRGPSCRDPAPIERIPRKRKRSSAKCSVTVSTKRKGIFFLVDPKIFIFPNTPARNYETCITPPSSLPVFASNSSSSSTPKKLDREFDCEKESTQTNHGEERCLRYPPQPFRSMVDSEQRFTQHLLLDQPLSSSYFTPRPATQITMEFDTPSLEDFMEEIRAETEEVIDHQKITASVFQSLLVPDDMIHLTESVFAPFGLRDSTQVGKAYLFQMLRLLFHLILCIAFHCFQANCRPSVAWTDHARTQWPGHIMPSCRFLVARSKSILLQTHPILWGIPSSPRQELTSGKGWNPWS